MSEQLYINFDEYIRQGEPAQRERADAWRAANRNVVKGVEREPIFLIRFFRNLLLGEDNPLKNRYMMVNPPEEWKTPESEQAYGNRIGTSTQQRDIFGNSTGTTQQRSNNTNTQIWTW
jgi:hypothetical protein